MGLAVYNSTILDIRFPLCCYKKLLSPAVVPADRNSTVGVTKLHLSDLKEVMPVSHFVSYNTIVLLKIVTVPSAECQVLII